MPVYVTECGLDANPGGVIGLRQCRMVADETIELIRMMRRCGITRRKRNYYSVVPMCFLDAAERHIAICSGAIPVSDTFVATMFEDANNESQNG